MANNGHAECDKAIEFCSLFSAAVVRLRRIWILWKQQYAHSWNFFSFRSRRRVANNVLENRRNENARVAHRIHAEHDCQSLSPTHNAALPSSDPIFVRRFFFFHFYKTNKKSLFTINKIKNKKKIMWSINQITGDYERGKRETKCRFWYAEDDAKQLRTLPIFYMAFFFSFLVWFVFFCSDKRRNAHIIRTNCIYEIPPHSLKTKIVK